MQHRELPYHGERVGHAAHTARVPWWEKEGGIPCHTPRVGREDIQYYARVASLAPWVVRACYTAAPRSCIYGSAD